MKGFWITRCFGIFCSFLIIGDLVIKHYNSEFHFTEICETNINEVRLKYFPVILLVTDKQPEGGNLGDSCL